MSSSPERALRKVLITGAAGAAGSYLAEHIAAAFPSVELHGTCRPGGDERNLERVRGRIRVHPCDLTDFASVSAVVRAVGADGIFHLASHANVRKSFDEPVAILHNNVMGTAHLFEAVRQSGQDPVLLLMSTSEVYGAVDPKDVPISEDCPLRPVSPYAVSKTAQDLLGWTYFRSYGTKIIRIRMFGYLNARRRDLFASAFARQVIRAEAGLQREVLHGNIQSVRTLLDVRDAADAIWTAITRCAPGEAYNVGSTAPVQVGDFLKRLIERSRVPLRARQDPALLRPTDLTLQIPDVRKFEALTGWRPRRSLDEAVDYFLQELRAEMKKEESDVKS